MTDPMPDDIPQDAKAALDAVTRIIDAREKCTKGDYRNAEIPELDKEYDCPFCEGQGTVAGEQYINFDDYPLNVLFSGIGDEFMLWQEFFGLITTTNFIAIRCSLTANAALTERVRVLEDALNEVRKGVHPQFVLNRLITAALDAGKGA